MQANRFIASLLGSMLMGASLLAQASFPGVLRPTQKPRDANNSQWQQKPPAQGIAGGPSAPKGTGKIQPRAGNHIYRPMHEPRVFK